MTLYIYIYIYIYMYSGTQISEVTWGTVHEQLVADKVIYIKLIA